MVDKLQVLKTLASQSTTWIAKILAIIYMSCYCSEKCPQFIRMKYLKLLKVSRVSRKYWKIDINSLEMEFKLVKWMTNFENN